MTCSAKTSGDRGDAFILFIEIAFHSDQIKLVKCRKDGMLDCGIVLV